MTKKQYVVKISIDAIQYYNAFGFKINCLVYMYELSSENKKTEKKDHL